MDVLILPIAVCFCVALQNVDAYRGSPWAGHPMQGAHYPPPRPMGGYNPAQAWGSWPPPTPPKFGPVSSANSQTPETTPKTSFTIWKLSTASLNRNQIPAAECRDGDKVYQPGDKWTPSGGCGRYSCTTAGKAPILGCPTPEPRDNCTVSGEDPRHPWPFCCPQLICD